MKPLQTEEEVPQAVSNLRSKFEQLAAATGGSTNSSNTHFNPNPNGESTTNSSSSSSRFETLGSSNNGIGSATNTNGSNKANGSSTGSSSRLSPSSNTTSNTNSNISASSHEGTSYHGRQTIQTTVPRYSGSLSPSSAMVQSTSSSSSETSSSGSKAAALKRPPPPPPPSRAPRLLPKRSLSPMPSVVPPSPLTRPVPLPPIGSGIGITGFGDSSPLSLKPKIIDKPPVPPRPSSTTASPLPHRTSFQVSLPDETSALVEDPDTERSSRPSVFLPPPRHRASLSPNLPPIEGLPYTPPPLPIRRTPMPNDLRAPPSPRPEGNPPEERRSIGASKLPPPPTRTIAPGVVLPPIRPISAESSDEEDDDEGPEQLPDSSISSRRPPLLSYRPGYPEPRIPFHAHGGSVLSSGASVIVAHGIHIKVYNLEAPELLVHNVEMKDFGLKDSRVACMEFRPCLNQNDRGKLVWLGTKEGSIVEFDIRVGSATTMRPAAHLHPITHIFRHARSMVTLDESGKALIFSPDPERINVDIDLKETQPRVVRTTDKQEFVRLLDGKLWTSGKGEYGGGSKSLPVVRIFDIFGPGAPGKSLLPTDHVGKLTSATILPTRPNSVYVGHEEGFVSVWRLDTEDHWPQCEDVVRVSMSDVLSLEGVNDKLWAGGRGGTISTYDVTATPWRVTNNWVAHPGLPVLKLSVNFYGIDTGKKFCVMSLGRDEVVRFWDGLLGLDWVDNELIKNETSFSTFQEIDLLLVTFNVSAVKPEALHCDMQNQAFFTEVFNSVDSAPDILSFSFQEVVDLEKRSVMTKSVLLTTGKKPDALSDRVTGNYKRWYDKLVGAVKTNFVPLGVEYDMVQVESLVGLFTCIFVKRSDQIALRDVAIASIKRGLGGRYGNKGAIISRLVIGDSSLCFINCHLAAGQHGVRRRNADITTFIEDKALFSPSTNEVTYVGGGNGTMILDHEFVLWNGDMNYRVDLRREAAISAIKLGDLNTLRNADQLLREMKTTRGFRLRGFSEGPLNFAPTYKYDPRSNEYDTSEKRRVPAWCDRVLWRSRVPARMKQVHYRRYDNVNVSDHRPVSAAFKATIKRIQREDRARSKAIVEVAWADEVERLLESARDFYVQQGLL